MGLLEFLRLIEPMEWLTIGLVLFAGAQLWVQERTTREARREKLAADAEATDRAFHFVWAEHFRLNGLSEHLNKADLIEMAYLDVLRPSEVLPQDWSKLTEALASLSREAGFLGGVAVSLCFDVERAISILVNSVQAFTRELPEGIKEFERVQYLREHYGADLAPWETSVRKQVAELSALMWDAAKHNPRIALVRQLHFSDDLSSEFAKGAVKALSKKSQQADKPSLSKSK